MVLPLMELPLQSNAVPLTLTAPFTGTEMVAGEMVTEQDSLFGLRLHAARAATASMDSQRRGVTRASLGIDARTIGAKTRMRGRPV